MLTAEQSSKTLKLLRSRFARTFKVPSKDLPRVFFHGLILAFIIAGFWLLDSLKDPILISMVGIEYQPIAKLLSVISTLFIVCIYDFLTSIVSKPMLFHILSGYFGITVMVTGAFLTDPSVGLDNTHIGPHRALGWFTYFTIEAYGSLMVALFWSFTNSLMDLEQAKGAYGLIIALAQIGAISGSTLATNASTVGISQLFLMSAVMIFCVSLLIKCYMLTFKDYNTTVSTARVRSISESSMSEPPLNMSSAAPPVYSSRAGSYHASSLRDVGGTVGSVASEEGFGRRLINALQKGQRGSDFTALDESMAASAAGNEDGRLRASSNTSTLSSGSYPFQYIAEPAVKLTLCQYFIASVRKVFGGFSEGLSLLFRYRYMLKVLGVSALYEVIVTILDYEFKIMGSNSVEARLQGQEALEGGSTAGDEFANLLGHFGQFTNFLSFLLSFFGFAYLVNNIGVRFSLMIFPCTLLVAVVLTNLVPSLRVLFIMVSIMKAMIFSLHDPVKELLYIPTSDAIKFKAKAWIDVFGARLAKAAGSTLCSFAGANVSSLRHTTEMPMIVLAVAIIVVTWMAGTEFQSLIASKSIVGADLGMDTLSPESLVAAGLDVGTVCAGDGRDQQSRLNLPVRNGLRPGDVGYDGYDLQLFEGVFDDEGEDTEDAGDVGNSEGGGDAGRCGRQFRHRAQDDKDDVEPLLLL